MAARISTRNRATMEKSSLLLYLKFVSLCGAKVTFFGRLDWKKPCMMHKLANQLRLSHKGT